MQIIGKLIIFCIFVIWWILVYQFAQKQISFHIKLLTILSWSCWVSAYALFPIDIFMTTHYEDSEFRRRIESLWDVIYWGNFLFSWIILPFFMYYENCGEFELVDKIKRSLIENLYFYVYFSMAALPILAFTYYLGMLDNVKLIDLAVSASNSIGIILCMIWLSYSIHFIPLRLIKSKDNKKMLKMLQYEISMSNFYLKQMKMAMCNNIIKLIGYENNELTKSNPQLSSYVKEIKKKISRKYISRAKNKIFENEQAYSLESPDAKSLINLHKAIKEQNGDICRLKVKQKALEEKAILIEEILDSNYMFTSKNRGQAFQDYTSFSSDPVKNFKFAFLIK